jgi:hypothetical protein
VAGKLLGEVAVTSSTLNSNQRSQRATAVSPTVQILPGSGQPRLGKEPKLQHDGLHLHLNLNLDTTEGSVPFLLLPPPAMPALDRPGALPVTLKLL